MTPPAAQPRLAKFGNLAWAIAFQDEGCSMGWLQNKFEKNFMISTVDYVFNWARKSAVWPMT
ncbi:MAG: hypothetical protein WCF74_02660, partial [Candidatus Sulfotelmatobacter sp.]